MCCCERGRIIVPLPADQLLACQKDSVSCGTCFGYSRFGYILDHNNLTLGM
jgi:hypothetical protein